MAQHIRKCADHQNYTIAKNCFVCGKETILPRPPKFSLDDKYASLRRESKKEELQEKNLI